MELWRRLLESPYDDVRLNLVADLENRVAQGRHVSAEHAVLSQELVQLLWASVLLNIHRGGRAKPFYCKGPEGLIVEFVEYPFGT